jgi:hypothetical protein
MNAVTKPEAQAVAEGEAAEKKGAPPVLRSNELVLWPTKNPKVLTGRLFGETRVVANINVSSKSNLSFISLSAPEGKGADTKWAELGSGNALNHRRGKDGELQKMTPADGVRRMVFDVVDPKGGEEKMFSVFITKAMTPELFNSLGFEGEMTTDRKKKVEAEEEAPAAPKP